MAALLFVSLALALALSLFLVKSRKSINAPRVGISPGLLGLRIGAAKRQYMQRGNELVQEGYNKYPKENFLVQMPDMERLVISPEFLPELRHVSGAKLSHAGALVEEHLGHFTGLGTILESRQHSDVCRLQLTQNLPLLVPAMSEEIDLAMARFLEKCSTENFSPFKTYEFVFAMILSATSRAFIDEPVCRDPEWVQVISSYLGEVLETGNALRPYPALLRPLLRPFLRPRWRVDAAIQRARKLLGPEISRRRKDATQHNDLLQYLVDTSESDNEVPIILKLLVLNSAALHTSCMAAVNAVLDMCERPDHLQSLRQEALDAFRSDGNVWKLSTLDKLKQLDAFFKESMRFNPPDALRFHRKAYAPISLSNGQTIPSGTFIAMPAQPMSRDPRYYKDPNTFDPGRFRDANAAGDATTNPVNQFSGIEKSNVMWGNGRLTCPGRWFASAMNRLIVGSLLVHYEFKFPDGQSARPESIRTGGSFRPSLSQEILVRKLG